MMQSIIAPTTAERVSYTKTRRQLLRVLGHERADTMHADALPEALQQLSFKWSEEVVDDAAAVLTAKPAAAEWMQGLFDDSTPDEAASVLSYVFDRIVEPYDLGFTVECVA